MKKPTDIDVYLGDYRLISVYDRWGWTLAGCEGLFYWLIDKGEDSSSLHEHIKQALMISYPERISHALAYISIYDIMIKKMDRGELQYSHDLSRAPYRAYINELFELTCV